MDAPGVVVVATFTKPNQSKYGRRLHYASYLDYKNREEAVKKPLAEEDDARLDQAYEGYMDYMGNPDKSLDDQDERVSGLFTAKADALTEEDIQILKEQYSIAQENGSLMWETVISFDNDWLSEMGVYDKKTGQLDENRMRNATRKAVTKLLEKEELGGAVWSAAFHYNTDNIHAHISIVEPHPTRKKKLYKQYEITTVDGKHQYKLQKNEATGKLERIPILDEDGNICEREEYVGRFKERSLKAAKSAVVEELVQDKELNIEINQLIRQRLVQSLKDDALYQDEDFRERFLQIYEQLPENHGVCNYKNSAMARLRPEIDALTDLYIEKYHKDDFEALQAKLKLQAGRYKAAYRQSGDSYMENKMDDLYYRMGNAILREMKDSAKALKQAGMVSTGRGDSRKANPSSRAESDRQKPGKEQKTGKAGNQAGYRQKGDNALRSAFYWLHKSLEDTLENWLNQRDYEELQSEITGEREFEME